MDYKAIGERIKNLREINNYTREKFAETAEVSPKFLYEIETGRKGFSTKTLVKISEALSVSCDYIIFGVNNDKRIDGVVNILLQFDNAQIRRLTNIIKNIHGLSMR